jgi:hypothetical protein
MTRNVVINNPYSFQQSRSFDIERVSIWDSYEDGYLPDGYLFDGYSVTITKDGQEEDAFLVSIYTRSSIRRLMTKMEGELDLFATLDQEEYDYYMSKYNYFVDLYNATRDIV